MNTDDELLDFEKFKRRISAPRTYQRHAYDIDVFEILDELRLKILSPGNEEKAEKLKEFDFIKEDEDFFVSDMQNKGIDLTGHRKNRNFILPSSYNIYYWYLGWKLLVMDIYKVEAVLSYQAISYKGNHYAEKKNFLGLVEFLVYSFMKQRIFPNENIRLEKIMNWVERKRDFAANKKNLGGFKMLEFRPITIDPLFASQLCEKLQPYFSETQHEQLSEAITKGHIIRGLCFDCSIRAFVDVFKRLRYHKKIVVKNNEALAHWLTDVFCTKEDGGQLKPLNYETVFDILKRTKNEPSKSNRILEDFVAFVPKVSRKDQKPPAR